MSDKQEKIYVKGVSQAHPMSAILFLQEYEKLVREGYTLHPDPKGPEIPCFVGFPRCIMVTEEYAASLRNPAVEQPPVEDNPEDVVVDTAVVSEENSVDVIFTPEIAEELEEAKTKAELFTVAEKMGVIVPDDKKVPKAIKQYLINLTK